MIPTSSPTPVPFARRRLGLAALGLAAALALAACGDDGSDVDDAAPGDTPRAPAATVADTAPAATTTPETTAAAATDATEATDAPDASSEATGATDASDGSEATAGSGEVAVAVGDTDLGSVLVDGAGMTLYVFIPDGQGESTCLDACLSNWPALIGPASAGEGVDEALLGTVARPDGGGDQVTYNDWPLYYFAADLAPGDTSGQGLGDVWFAIDAAGEPVPAD